MISIPADLNGPDGDLLQQVLVGNETFIAAHTTLDGQPVLLVLARGPSAVQGLKTLLYGSSGAAPSEPDAESVVARARPPVPIATGGASAEPAPSSWEDVTSERVAR
jgi:hypothetical protein